MARQIKHIRLVLSIVTAFLAFSCGVPDPVVEIARYSFKCTEVGAPSSVGSYTKLSGTPFNLDIVAFKDGVETTLDDSYRNSVSTTFELVETASQATCENNDTTKIPDASTFSVPYELDGRMTISGINVTNTHQTLMCRINLVYEGKTYPKCGNVTFATRPAYFAVTSTNANADVLGSSTTSAPKFKASRMGASGSAGTQFNLTATAKDGSNNTLTNYNGIVSIVSPSVQSGYVAGTLYPSTFNAANQGVASSNFTYSEVGYFKFLPAGVVDNTYTAIDKTSKRCIENSNSNTLISGKYGCNIANVDTFYFGRFIPYTFKTTVGTTTQYCTSGAFTYFGSEFTTRFKIEAASETSSSSVSAEYLTKNYTGAFAKFSTGLIGKTYSAYNFALSPAVAGVSLSQGSLPPTIDVAWSNGEAFVTATHKTSRPVTNVAPTSLVINATPTDTEAVSASATTLSSPLLMRLGRLKLNNAYGAETLPLRVSLFAEYWDGITWLTHTDDSCSVLAANHIYLQFPNVTNNHLQQCESILTALNTNNKFASGVVQFQFSAPGDGNYGWLTMSPNLGWPGVSVKSYCTAAGAYVPTSDSGLTQFLDSVLNELSATISFGQYKSSTIYNREN